MNLIAIVQVVLLVAIFIAVVSLLLRKPTPPAADPQLAQLPGQITMLKAHSELLSSSLRGGLGELRTESSDNATRLRVEITGNITALGALLNTGLAEFRSDNDKSAAALSANVRQQLDAIAQQLSRFISEANRIQIESRESLNGKLGELSSANTGNLEKIRETVEERLDKLNVTNAAKLEEMRLTVDEKLHATLHTRLTESFGQVTTHLGEVQKGLGEMKELASGVSTLNRVFTNVSRRGGFAEVQLGMQLEQILAPNQYIKNAQIKSSTEERVEYAIRFPKGENEQVLLSIDAKFPKEDWEKLEAAYESGIEVRKFGEKFEASIRKEGKRICEKYIDPPTTLPYAVMYLPTESLYAEVLRRPGLLSDLQNSCHITVAGPQTLMSILSNCQMLFYALSFQKRSDEVWKVLSLAKTEFNNFSVLMDSVTKQVGTVQTTLKSIGGKTKTINRALKNVVPSEDKTITPQLEEIAGVLPLLAAEDAE